MSITFNILNEIDEECKTSRKLNYNRYVFSKLGKQDGPKIDGPMMDVIEICQAFERLHEKDNEIDEVYVGDEAFPDHQLHYVWTYNQNYDEAAQEYDVIIAKKAFEKAFGGQP
jgi:hypothetical protein